MRLRTVKAELTEPQEKTYSKDDSEDKLGDSSAMKRERAQTAAKRAAGRAAEFAAKVEQWQQTLCLTRKRQR